MADYQITKDGQVLFTGTANELVNDRLPSWETMRVCTPFECEVIKEALGSLIDQCQEMPGWSEERGNANGPT